MQEKESYWDGRYSNAGTSGSGSVGELRDWKWKLIQNEIGDITDYVVIDYGCGDQSFWEGKVCKEYFGIDASQVLIDKNRKKFPGKKYYHTSEIENLKVISSDIVFCFDVLFHIIEEEEYLRILDNLINFSNKYVFIFTWSVNPFLKMENKKRLLKKLKFKDLILAMIGKLDTDYNYQKYRNFKPYIEKFVEAGFKLKMTTVYDISTMYVFEKPI